MFLQSAWSCSRPPPRACAPLHPHIKSVMCVLGQRASLTELNLSSCKMRYLAMGFTAPVPFDSLAVLNLHDNALGIAGMVMLSGFLRACTALTDLSVSCNRF